MTDINHLAISQQRDADLTELSAQIIESLQNEPDKWTVQKILSTRYLIHESGVKLTWFYRNARLVEPYNAPLPQCGSVANQCDIVAAAKTAALIDS